MELPSESAIQWLVRRYAALLSRKEDPNAKHIVVLPNGQFFPDDFEGDVGSINLLFWRLQEHSGLTDLDVELRFVDDGVGAQAAGGCSTGSCGTRTGVSTPVPVPPVVRLPDAYRIDVLLSQARSAVTLTSYLATALARIHIEETGGFGDFPEEEWRSTCELAAISLGFGMLLANASYMFSKGCGGVNVDRNTSLFVTELALGLAIFVAHQQHPGTAFVASLETTQRSAWREAKMWTDSNPKLIQRLRKDPKSVAEDETLGLAEAKPWLARVLGLGAKKRRVVDAFDEDGFAQFEAEMRVRSGDKPTSKRDPKLDEIRALVDESFEEVRATREV